MSQRGFCMERGATAPDDAGFDGVPDDVAITTAGSDKNLCMARASAPFAPPAGLFRR